MSTNVISASQRAVNGLASPPSSAVFDRARVPAASPDQAVRAAARAVPDSELRAVCRGDISVAMQPRAMLAVLGCCYAYDIYASWDVEQLMRRDAEFRRLCGNEFPDALTLKRFRRYNREALERCVMEMLRAVAVESGKRPTDGELRDEAHERVNTAILMDMHENY